MHPVKRQSDSRARRKASRGIALITALIMLLVITLLSLAGARIALDSKRSTRNQRDFEIAFEAAQAALRDAELDINVGSRKASFLATKPEGFVDGCGTGNALGLCTASDGIWDTIDWTATNGQKTVEYGQFTAKGFPTGNGLTPERKPRYIIEVMQNTKSGGDAGSEAETVYMYRVTAVGFGPNDTTRAMVQMTYSKPGPAAGT